ncbi:MAG TPA: RNA polymerase sigma factor [Jatrophihabitantaceae bacterium]|nr:RNA polymerase sigma factor [Jatrophihabitantaceae bacterium]
MASTREADEFADWVRPALLPMTRLARRLAPDHDPQDVVQDALVRAWRKRHLFDPERGTATTWLLAITADRARDARRTRNRQLRVVDDTTEPPDVSVSASDVAEDIDVDRAIRALPERQRLAVELHYFLGLTVVETGAVMECSDGTVKSTLFDARASLRKSLGDER